ncbi:hypothetical protein NMY22_g18636 [Coprinellus aureogranulatus]|nr:hypothetical protein NMY22_g18636 [Coprinellus aureogranulatus]
MILQEWENIERSIQGGTFYEQVSLDEKLAIVKAMDFGYTGHWYNCPNGHTFVIGEVRSGLASVCGYNDRADDARSAEEPWRRLAARSVEKLSVAEITLSILAIEEPTNSKTY